MKTLIFDQSTYIILLYIDEDKKEMRIHYFKKSKGIATFEMKREAAITPEFISTENAPGTLQELLKRDFLDFNIILN